MTNRSSRLSLLVLATVLGQLTSFARLVVIDATTTPSAANPSNHIAMEWNQSPDTDVIGYFVYYGVDSGPMTNRLNAGLSTNLTIGGLESPGTYHFRVVAYDIAGQESVPSNEIDYTVTPVPPSTPPQNLQLQSMTTTVSGPVLNFQFQAVAGKTYKIEGTQDFQHWDVASVTNCVADGLVAIQVLEGPLAARRFYRLAQY